MDETKIIRGFKVFNPDWTCKNKQYTCPGIFGENVTPSVCDRGMHFCKKAADCFNYYSFNPENKVAEVIALANRTVEGGDKCATNYLEIVREISWQEVLEIVNTGKGCTGLCNSGDCNSGDWNSGDWNSGDWNSGDWNSGNWNSGDWNSGDQNKCSFSNGCYNTAVPKIYLFNKLSDWTYQDWRDSHAYYILNKMPGNLEYVSYEDMTGEEKAAHPEAKITGGYIKQLENSERRSIWWKNLNANQKSIIKSIPNFNKEIFKEITGIDVDEVNDHEGENK